MRFYGHIVIRFWWSKSSFERHLTSWFIGFWRGNGEMMVWEGFCGNEWFLWENVLFLDLIRVLSVSLPYQYLITTLSLSGNFFPFQKFQVGPKTRSSEKMSETIFSNFLDFIRILILPYHYLITIRRNFRIGWFSW